MSFQDTRTPQYPEMQKQKPYGWLRNHPQKPADSRQNTGITKNPVGHSSQYGQGFEPTSITSTQFTTFQTVISVIFTGKLYHK